MKKIIVLIVIISNVYCNAQQIELELFASGFTKPVNIQNAGDSRLFVLEQDGDIRILNEDGTVNSQPFLNIKNKVNDAGGERGLLGLAFHPEYGSNGYFYVNYVNKNSETIISRFSTLSTDPNLADATSEFILITLPQPYANHNGGELVFGNDGYLFIALGDGGSGGDPDNRAQDLQSLFGKLLRIDVDHPQNGDNYGIPEDNPFAQSMTHKKEIWAYGLRNPWRFSLDKTTNELWIADVGQSKIEEINKVSTTLAPLNYGWRCYEGREPYNLDSCPDSKVITFPISEYTHNNSGVSKCSITGGFRYRGALQPHFEGIYFFADYCSGEIGMLKENGAQWDMSFSEVFDGKKWTTFGEDNHGELYIADMASGSIFKLKDGTLSIDERDFFQVKIYPNPVTENLTIYLDILTSVKPKIFIYNVQKQLIEPSISIENNRLKVSMQHVARGLYFLEIQHTNQQKSLHKFLRY